jgi:hypothetical protein
LPYEVGRSPKELDNPLLGVSGIYSDGWIGNAASLQLAQPPGPESLRVRGVVPRIKDPAFHTNLELRLDDSPVALRKLGLGNFDISIPVPEGAHSRRVTLTFSRTETLPGGDGRRVSARLESVGFVKQDHSKVVPVAEITGGPQVHLGSGWGPLETFSDETFRWVANDAQVAVDIPGQNAVVTLMLEPGPGAAGQPLLLRVLDESGRQVWAVVLDRRRTVQVPVPLKGGGATVFTLHAEGGGASVPKESRILNFRVFALDAEPWGS